MRCQEFLATLDLFLEQAAGSAKLEAGRLHLEQCSSCREIVALYQRTGELTREAFDVHSDADGLPEELIRSILERWRSETSAD